VARDTAAAGPVRKPAAGELWRAGTDDALLVWVRNVRDGAVDVIPVVLDAELADDATLLLPAEDSSLGMGLAVITSLRSLVHPGAFLTFVAELPTIIAGQTMEVAAARQEGRRPRGAPVGTAVKDPDDQRVEYQQTLADVLAELAPATWQRRRSDVAHDAPAIG
jgi:hypothetical protein